MIRTQISLTPEQAEAARAEAERRGVSMASLLRQALDRMLAEGRDDDVIDRARRGVGGFRSGSSTTSVDHDEALTESARW